MRGAAVLIKKSYSSGTYLPGMKQPAWFVHGELRGPIARDALLAADQLAADLIPDSPDPVPGPDQLPRHPVLRRLIVYAMRFLLAAGMPVFSRGRTLRAPPATGGPWMVALPAIGPDVPAPGVACQLAARLLNACLSGTGVDDAFREEFADKLAAAGRDAPGGSNRLSFLHAAHELGIPWRQVSGQLYQFGWGRNSRWLDSSFTDSTPFNGVVLARDKYTCASLLRAAGLPVPVQSRVSTMEETCAAAERIGYPVVLKPMNLDGGRGVYTGLRDRASLEDAFESVRGLSRHLLVEEHIEGEDYRLQVFKDHVYWATHRRPAYVLGDGTQTVEMLVAETNRRRAAQVRGREVVKEELGSSPIELDRHVDHWLSAQGLARRSVPAPGQHVRLRGAANVSKGGTRTPVLDRVHPDNAALAVRAANLLRLDLAGVDLLMPDVGKSWLETGAVICEVNGQPQMSAGLHRQVLSWLVPSQGRVPVVLAVGCGATLDVHRSLFSPLVAAGRRVGFVGRLDAWLGPDRLDTGPFDRCAVARGLLSDPRLEGLIVECHDAASMLRELVVDFADLLILGPAPKDAQRGPSPLLKGVAAQEVLLSEELGSEKLVASCRDHLAAIFKQEDPSAARKNDRDV